MYAERQTGKEMDDKELAPAVMANWRPAELMCRTARDRGCATASVQVQGQQRAGKPSG